MPSLAQSPMKTPDPAEGVLTQLKSAPLWPAIAMTLVFAGVVSVGLIYHEIWRDEAKAWLIARDSSSLLQVYRNRAYEGHPVVWYVLLHYASLISRDPITMQILHGILATAGAFVFARAAPLGNLTKVLFLGGYFPVYEYAVVSRNYAAGVLLLWILLALFTSARQRPVLMAVVLALLASTSLYGLLLAFALVAAWLVRRAGSQNTWTPPPHGKWTTFAGGAIVLAGLAAAFIQMVPPPPIAQGSHHRLEAFHESRFAGATLASAISRVATGYLPTPAIQTPHPAGSTATLPGPALFGLRLVVAILILLTVMIALRASPAAIVFFTVATGTQIAFKYFLFDGGMRHHGHLYLAFIAAVWIWRGTTQRPIARAMQAALMVVLLVQLAAGICALVSDIRYPFSPSREAADLLSRRYGRNFSLLANPGHLGSPVAAYLDVPVYFAARRAWATFELLDGTPKIATPSELSAALREVSGRESRPAVLLSAEPIRDHVEGIALIHLASQQESLVWEGWELYEVRNESDKDAVFSPQPH